MISSTDFFNDIYALWKPAWWQNPRVWCAVFVIMSILVVFIFWWVRARRRARSINYLDILLKRLHILSGYSHETIQEQRIIYSAMVELIKECITYKYGLKVYHLTDFELLDFLKKYGDDSYNIAFIKILINNAYHTKFAQQCFASTQVQEDKEKIHNFVKKFLEQKINT
ncbi:MAG: DUF4381 family protein [Candidatus Babeliaceae bacterium]